MSMTAAWSGCLSPRRAASAFGYWTVASQRAIGALLQPLGDDELDIIASGLAALQRAFQRAQERGTAGRAGSPPPC